jgi:hypothetical protein
LTAQIGYQIVGGASSLSLGGASVSLQDEQAVFHNPAGLMGTTKPTALLTSEIKFGLTDLKPIGCAYILPTASGNFGFTFQNYSFETFHESKLGIAYSRRLFSKLNVGIQLDYLRLKIGAYGSANILAFGIGCNTFITNDLVLSFCVYNPILTALDDDNKTPSVFRLGLGYNLNSKVLLCLETEKDIEFPTSFKFGLAYKVIETLTLRCGFRTTPNMFSFGMGYVVKNHFTIDVALANHPNLGLTPALSLMYALK